MTDNQEIPEFLNTLKANKSNGGFKAPDGYFDSLHERVLQRIEDENTEKRTAFNYKPFLAIAASFVLLFGIWGTVAKLANTNVPLAQTDDIYGDYLSYAIDDAALYDAILADNGTAGTDTYDEAYNEAILEYLGEEADFQLIISNE